MSDYQIIKVRVKKGLTAKDGNEAILIGAEVADQNMHHYLGLNTNIVKSVQRIAMEIQKGNHYSYVNASGEPIPVIQNTAESATSIATDAKYRDQNSLLDLPRF
ncbi:hypothetical protein [Convivina praedatoris]|uniref:DUF3892 domain-containing protein n=1 Tax=Convivina praedatoris TaxID=2880963 RepID=A0ABM9D3Q3_9LACO|nr:hypothetical protein [Convivina sp. LMG 32447]CAH1852471.1 hypothetical protein LMG032447_00587 [Convivina sp. LMG 32447]CAH1852507.1 hypothetical protein R078138_00597 [Convivina sp. LMG 32447]CAH1855080.1 hypothetical protein R077815_01144 [Convivina sp. LMG 32447]